MDSEKMEKQVDKVAHYVRVAIQDYIGTDGSRLNLTDEEVTVIAIKALQNELESNKQYLMDLRRPVK